MPSVRPRVLPVLLIFAAHGTGLAASGALEQAMDRLRSSRRAGGPSSLAARIPEDSETPTAAMPLDVGGVEEAPGTGVKVPVPRRRRLRKLRLSLDWVPLRLEEAQGAAQPTTFVSIGRRIDTSVSFLPGGNIRENREEQAASMAVFLKAPAVHIYGMRLRVLSYTGPSGMRMEGASPAIGQVELFEVREVGDVRGDSVLTVPGVAFQLAGRETVIPLDVAADPRKRYMAVVSIPAEAGEAASVNVPVASEGDYPALVLEPKNNVPRRQDKPLFDAAVSFEYKPDPGVVRPYTEVTGDFLGNLEDFLEANPGVDSVPLKVLVE